MPLLEIRNLTVELRGARAPAVRDFSIAINPGEIVGLVGESGGGKTMVALAIMRLLPVAARITAGQMLLNGDGGARDLTLLSAREMRAVRGARIGIIFQDPLSALNPLMRAGDQIAEALRAHTTNSTAQAKAAARELLGQLGVPEPERRMQQYPHELSGGMRQRVMIAMALAGRPALLLADEPTTALDVTRQAQVLALLFELRARYGMAILFITHDIAAVAQIADRIAVMSGGTVVEQGPALEVLRAPVHPYTRELLNSVASLSHA